MEWIDLRSDTVTKPTAAMREAMAHAEVGDDVFGEDPTVNHLQEMAALRMGKEAALFVPSGTMGNLIAVLAHCQRGDEAVMGEFGHTFLFEGGGISSFGGVFPHTLPNQPDGTILLEDLKSAIRPDDVHHPITKLIILENTHNRCGGVVLPAGYTAKVREVADSQNLLMHLDGARIFNAAAAQGIAASSLAAPFDSVTFCLSKGLCAPVGSVLCGSLDFINRGRRLRKALGGGMRQAGILAAAGVVALEQMVDRLPEDHRRAQELAKELKGIPGIKLTFGEPQTNMVFLDLEEDLPVKAKEVAVRILKRGIKVGVVGEKRFRLVTHAWIDDEAVKKTITAFTESL